MQYSEEGKQGIVRAGTEKAVVTGLFDDLPESVKAKLSDNGFAVDDELLLQRDIHADGKSTARINGRATTVAILRDIASELIDIHGQHDNRLLMDGDNQREILDSYGKNSRVAVGICDRFQGVFGFIKEN